MEIKYYTVDNYRGYLNYPEELNNNFISIDRAKNAIKEFYKFEPSLSINSDSLNYLYQYEKVVEKTPIYKVYKSGPRKGGIVEKQGQKVVLKFSEHSYNKQINIYSGHNYTKSEFLAPSPYYLENVSKLGYYELKYDSLPIEEIEKEIKYKAQVFIRFITAKKIVVPEIKEVGKPYQAPSERIEIIKESEFFPLYECPRNMDSFCYGICNNMDNWYKTSLVYVEHTVSIEENKINILE